jgi:hypothetical protein
VSRLLKSDLVAVLAELQRQEQVFLCMKVRHFFSHFVCVDENMLKKKISSSLVELQSFLCFGKLKQSVTERIGYAMPFMLFGEVTVFLVGYV